MRTRIDKMDLREVLSLVKAKLRSDVYNACGIMWSDSSEAMTVDEENSGPTTQPNARYAVREPDVYQVTTKYAVGEED